DPLRAARARAHGHAAARRGSAARGRDVRAGGPAGDGRDPALPRGVAGLEGGDELSVGVRRPVRAALRAARTGEERPRPARETRAPASAASRGQLPAWSFWK